MVSAAELLAAGRAFKRADETLFGQPVKIRSLSGSERQLLRSRAADGDPLTSAGVVALAVCGPDGEPLFTLEQAEALEQCDGGELDRLALAVLDLSGLAPKAGEDAAKN